MHKHNIESHLHTLKQNGLGEHERELAWSRIATNLASRKKPALSFSSFSRKLAAVLVVAVTLMGTGALTASAHGTMPGDLLFPVKIATENVQIFLARDLQKKEALRIKFAEVRLAEVRALIDATTSDGALSQALASGATGTSTGATISATSTATSTADGTTTLFLPKTTVKKIERAERAITIALRELEQTRAALLSSGSAESVLVIDDIIAELRGTGDGSVTITKIASGGTKKGDSEKVVLHATLTNTASTSSAFAGKVTINEKKGGATITIKNANIKTEITVKERGATTTMKEKDKVTHREDDEDDEDEDKHDANDDRDHDRKDNKNEKKAKICHRADGEHHTIEVSVSSARAHLAHGDILGECRDNDDHNTPPVVDTTAPVISAIAATQTTTSATITFTTNEGAKTKMWISTSTPVDTLGETPFEESGFATTHSIIRSSLTPGTTYRYVLSAVDSSGNRATSTEHTLTTADLPPPADTTAPTISEVSVATTTSSARVSWKTNEPASGVLFYGVGDPLGSSGTQIDAGGLALAYDVLLSGLTASTTYQFFIVAKDGAGNTATSSASSFAIE